MPTFLYEAVDSSGQKIRQKVEAQDKKAAVAIIRKKGLRPTGIKELEGEEMVGGESTAPSLDTSEPTRRGGGTGKVPRKLLTEFSTQLSILQTAGLPIVILRFPSSIRWAAYNYFQHSNPFPGSCPVLEL